MDSIYSFSGRAAIRPGDFTSSELPVQIRNSQLKHAREPDPDQIWNLHKGNPVGMGVNSNHCPDKRAKDKQYIYARQEIIFQAELDGRESEIENEIENEGQEDNKVDFLLISHEKHLAKRNGNNDVQDAPHWPEQK
jgi:hypothetical protein